MHEKLLTSLSNDVQNKIIPYLNYRPVPLGKIAKSLGIQVFLSKLESGISGLIRKEEGKFVIKINMYEARSRQRFTLAHELAHFLLHQDILNKDEEIRDTIMYRSGNSDKIEYDANRLAAEILMPDDKAKNDLDWLRNNMSEDNFDMIASKWEVSNLTLRIKLTV